MIVNKESKNAQNAANRRSDIFSLVSKCVRFVVVVGVAVVIVVGVGVAAAVVVVVVIFFVVVSAAVVVAVVVAWGKNSFKLSCEVPTSIREGIHQNLFRPP